ncbi:nucleotidyl transferase AbiEii/AbiGii toxin family protein [Gordonia sp. CPCC 205515]|uniref:nucleotidyl transferase AbiEii/AbiGii toxin family protein n=1 Tax=Gordonia sp. CPCC 205515 TaxID=3140791 RepID=UPI003AF39E8D
MPMGAVLSLFERPHHSRIASILEALDAELLAACKCYFGGGTAIALRYSEFRESRGIDLIVSDRAGYGDLRERVRRVGSINALTRTSITQLRPVRTDQYGIRTVVDADGAPIKLEIISEGRITLDEPASDDVICGVRTLTPLDMATTKLLANSDRWADRSVYSRDLIDLAMMDISQTLVDKAIAKAETAYRSSVIKDLTKSIRVLQEDPHRLDDCIRELHMTVPKAVLWARIKRLSRG